MQITLPIGSIIRDPDRNRYKVEACLGTGGFGSVYLVKTLGAQSRQYALKEIIDPSAQERERLSSEGDLLKRLVHPSLPRIHRIFEDQRNACTYLLMDYIKGADLEYLRKEQPDKRLTLYQLITVIDPVINAVNYLHSQHPPVIHRDIKPPNIIVPVSGAGTMLVDFGLAKEYVPGGPTTTQHQGTPGYAAPEQYGGAGRTTPRTDIYGLGATIYTLLTGIYPIDVIQRVMGEDGDGLLPVHLLVPGIPHSISDDIQRALSLNSQDRFASVNEFWHTFSRHARRDSNLEEERTTPLASLVTSVKLPDKRSVSFSQNIQRRQPRSQRPLLWFLLILVLLLSVTAAGLFFYRGAPSPRSIPARVGTTTPLIKVNDPSYPYPPLAPSYIGKIVDLSLGSQTQMTLSNITQDKQHIQGYFSGLGLSGAFNGTVTTKGHLTFTVPIYGGHTTLAFDGDIQVGGNVAGSYQVLNQQQQYTGQHGIWTLSTSG